MGQVPRFHLHCHSGPIPSTTRYGLSSFELALSYKKSLYLEQIILKNMIRERLSTGVEGLDALIEGGIPRGFTVLIAGNPGTGKTILASHFLYEGLAKDEGSVYVSFGESKSQYYTNLEGIGFKFSEFEAKRKFAYLDLASITKEGIEDSLEEVLATIRSIDAKRIVIDSFSAILLAFDNVTEARIALHVVLGKVLRAEGVTNMLITEVPVGAQGIGSGMEEFVADGIIRLEHGNTDAIPTTINVVKMRGTAIKREVHVSAIRENGMVVFPKQPLQTIEPPLDQRIKSGIPGFDEKIGGGFLEGSTGALVGPSGAGKTTLGFQFLANSVLQGQKAIFCSLEESPGEIRNLGQSLGYDVQKLEKTGLKILSWIPENQSLDAFIAELESRIKDIKPSLIVIDSLSAFENMYKQELYLFTKRLSSLFKLHRITSIFNILTSQQPGFDLTGFGVSSIFHNIVLLRYVEIEGVLKRSLLVLKMRASLHDHSILEFTIDSNGGIKIVGAIINYEGILSGIARKSYELFMSKEKKIEARQREQKATRKAKFDARQKKVSSTRRASGGMRKKTKK